jgi:nucleoside-diphosphate-sugar epimerase
MSTEGMCLITGATGFVGSHLAEACLDRGLGIRALVRPSSDTTLLKRLGAELVTGDLTEPDAVRRAVAGVNYVFHCAAKVGDWGPVEEYRAINVVATQSLLDACKGQPLRRFVHLSSLGVYPAVHHHGTDETAPLPDQHMDGYTQTKVESERLVMSYHAKGLPVTALRPGFIYGPRDRNFVPKLVENLRERRVRYLGSRHYLFDCIYVGNLVEAFFLARDNPAALGQVFNLGDGEPVTKQRFIEAVADGLGVPRPRPLTIPLWLARLVAFFVEGGARRRGAKEAPFVTQGRIKFLGLNLDYSIEKARRELGYKPPYSFHEGMQLTIAWCKENGV